MVSENESFVTQSLSFDSWKQELIERLRKKMHVAYVIWGQQKSKETRMEWVAMEIKSTAHFWGWRLTGQ